MSKLIAPLMVCSRCRGANDRPGQRYCRSCHAAYMRVWNRTHPRTSAQRHKAVVRQISNLYKSLGVLVAQPCDACGSAKSEMHHGDYDKPLDVRWLCRSCHLALHKQVSRETRRAEVVARLGAA